MLALFLALPLTTMTTPPPTTTVLFDDLLLACHRPAVGWFGGAACEAAAGGAHVVRHDGEKRRLPVKGRDAMCGGVEGHRGFGDGSGGGHLWFSPTAKPIPCPAEKAPKTSPAEKQQITAALKADFAARPAAWRTWVEHRDAKPLDPQVFEVKSAVRLGPHRFVHLQGFGRDVRALVRLGGPARVVARDAYGPVEVVPDRCADLDGDGAPEVWVAIGGETERSYALIRFVDDWPSTIATLGCGD